MRLSSFKFRNLAVGLLVAGGVATAALATDRGPVQTTFGPSDQPAFGAVTVSDVSLAGDAMASPADEQGRHLYIVRFAEPSLARYEGGIQGLEATSPQATGQRLDARSPAAMAYREFLAGRHDYYLGEIGQHARRSIEPVHQYLNVVNGLTIRLTPQEAEQVARLAFVAGIEIDRHDEVHTDEGPALIRAPEVWGGSTISGLENRGEGIIIGILDTGFNFGHPSFAEVADDGHVHENPYGDGVFTGLCADPGAPDFEDVCNNKVIGTYSLHPDSATSDDTNNHGTHVASTAAGNPLDIVFPFQYLELDVDISGVAPRANLINYKVCEPLCPASSRIAAVDHAIDDGVHVLNHSIGNSEPPWASGVSLAFLDANAAGIVVAASAGNSGPGASTVASTGPWNIAVGASTHQRRLALFANIAGGSTEYPGSAFGAALAGPYSGDLRYAGDVDPSNFLGCNPFPAGSFDDEAALIRRGECTFAQKVDNAVDAGANFVVIANNETGIAGLGGLEGASVTVLSVSEITGDVFIDEIDGTTAALDVEALIEVDPDNADIMAGFSSRGPASHNTIAPAITAPGAQILAGARDESGQFVAIGGTSMSSPHVAGAAALLMAENPDWTPTEIRSALTLVANPDHRKEDGATPADPFDMGSGRLDVAGAANIGFVMDESIANFVGANPADGGNPATLNLSSIKEDTCVSVCSFERTIRSVAGDPVDYTVATTAPAGVSITVTPSSFTLNPAAELTLEIDVDVTGAAFDEWLFADIQIVADAGSGSAAGSRSVLLEEGFEDTTFPPAGWSTVKLDGTGDAEFDWNRDDSQSNTGDASARRRFHPSEAGFQNDWLVTPPIQLAENSELTFFERGAFMTWYTGSFVQISTDSCDPADGDFVQLMEIDDSDGNWREINLDLSAYDNQEVCLAFHYTGEDGHSWWVDDVTVAAAGPASIYADTRMPVVVVSREPNPTIVVAPESLSAEQPADAVTSQQFTIANGGQEPLEWELNAMGPQGTGVPGPQVSTVIWDNPQFGTSGRISNFSIPDDTGIYQSDAFAILAPSSIETIFSAGFLLGSPGVTDLTWMVFEDNNGVPAGDPETNPEDAIWSFTAELGDPGVDFTNADMTLDLAAAGAPALDLDPGVYWLVAFPDVEVFSSNPSILYAWFHGESVETGRQIGPGGLIDFPTSWAGVPEGRAFTLTGTIDCSAEPTPWIAVTPASGTVGVGDTATVNVDFDSTGLPGGTYNTAFCILSNDPQRPATLMPVELNVESSPIASISSSSESFTIEAGDSTSGQVAISNDGQGELEFAVRGGSGGSLLGTLDLIYDQTASQTTNGTLAIYDLDGPATWAVQAADDFSVPAGESWAIDRVVANGFYQNLVNPTTSVRVFFYEDDGGQPGAEIESFTDLAPSDDDDGVLTVDLPNTVSLGAGNYWLSVQPEMDYVDDGQWFWSQNADQVGNLFHWRNPGNGYGTGCTDWEPGTSCGFSNPDLSFQLFGQADDLCEAIDDIAWLSVDPEAGTVAPEGGEQTIDLMIDGSALSEGSYVAGICFDTNDPESPTLPLEISLTVESEGDIEADVFLDDLVQTYTGDPLEVTVTTDPAGLAVEVTYDGSATPPTDAGDYAVVATVVESGYQGSASGTFTIEPAVATIAFGDLQQAFTGSPLSPTITTDPAGLSVIVTYDGSPNEPVDVGEYLVEVEVDDPNFTGSDSATFEILESLGDGIFHDRFEDES